jgi:gas vesicle protein
VRKRDRNVAIGTLIAAGIGYAAGVLTAPKSGRETRKDLQRAAIQAKKEAEKNFKGLHTELTKLIAASKRHGSKLSESKKAEFDKALNKAQNAKKKVGEILSAIHEGEAEDKDLKSAVSEVNAAIEHLRIYIEKAPKAK